MATIWLILTTGFGATGCQTEGKNEREATGTVASRVLVTQSIQLSFPSGLDSSKVALGALGGLLSVEDRSIIQEPNGALSAVSQIGAGVIMTLGGNAKVGSVTAQGSVALNSNSTVNGNVTTAGTIVQQTGVTITGTQTSNATITPLITESWPVEQPDNSARPIDYEPGTQGALVPGSYGTVAIKSRSGLTLTTGAYGFTSFDLEPQATLTIDDTAGPVRIYVQNVITYGGQVVSKSGSQPALLLAQVGTAPVGINATFTGELVAPNAPLTLGPGQTPHMGTFLAQSIDVRPGTIVTHKPYFKLAASPTWGLTAGTGAIAGSGSSGSAVVGPYATGAFTGSSTFITAGPTGVTSVSLGGIATTLTSTSGYTIFGIDPTGSRFSVIGAGQAQIYNVSSPNSPAFTVPTPGGPVYFIPSTNLVYVAQGVFGREHIEITGARIYSPSGLSASFATPGLNLVRLSSTSLIWATGSQLVSTSLTGVEQWRQNLALVTYEVSANGATLVGLLNSPGTSTIVNVRLSDGKILGTSALNGTFWNLAAAPGGRFTAATTQNGLTVFDTGSVARATGLPVTWANTLDVTDQGYAAVGGQVAPNLSELVLVGPPGSGTSVTVGSSEIDAYRPAVQFATGGQMVLLNGTSGIQAFGIQRTL